MAERRHQLLHTLTSEASTISSLSRTCREDFVTSPRVTVRDGEYAIMHLISNFFHSKKSFTGYRIETSLLDLENCQVEQ